MTSENESLGDELEAMLSGRSTVSFDGRYITINGPYEYNIELARCSTLKEICEWVNHVGRKTWATAEILADFVRVACSAIGQPLHSDHGGTR